MSALFNFQSLLTVVLLIICTCAYLRSLFPSMMDRNKVGYHNGDLLEMCSHWRAKIPMGSGVMLNNGFFDTVCEMRLCHFHTFIIVIKHEKKSSEWIKF
ncbi:DUF1242 domain containing protein [Asbolus verrucosus]|uniref:Protein kish n=1 Tax=Asbolus verrucosus TaxID=1661398 RepID=A0A482WCL9_ASBVE|nr:DUF1242 domain containing protein [Asbolus verrucosus]